MSVLHSTPPITGPSLQQQRLAHEIKSRAVATRAGLSIGRLSEIERGLIEASRDDLVRIDRALNELIRAQAAFREKAAEVGWPL